MVGLELSGATPEQIQTELGISDDTYWRWRGEREAQLSAMFLGQQWRLIGQWWERQQYACRRMLGHYAESVRAGKPRPDLLREVHRMENENLDRLVKLGLVQSKAVEANLSGEASMPSILKEIAEKNRQEGKNEP